jgi:hypothetical protein
VGSDMSAKEAGRQAGGRRQGGVPETTPLLVLRKNPLALSASAQRSLSQRASVSDSPTAALVEHTQAASDSRQPV